MDYRTAPHADPFADTADDPREVQRLIREAMARARRQRESPAAPPLPRLVWEASGHHGTGREVSLRSSQRPSRTAVGGRLRSTRLPPLPTQHARVYPALAIAAAVLGLGALGWYLWRRHKSKQATTHVGAEFDGLELLGALS